MSVTSVGASMVPWSLIVAVNFGLVWIGSLSFYFKQGLLEQEGAALQPLRAEDFHEEEGGDFGIDSDDDVSGTMKKVEV